MDLPRLFVMNELHKKLLARTRKYWLYIGDSLFILHNERFALVRWIGGKDAFVTIHSSKIKRNI